MAQGGFGPGPRAMKASPVPVSITTLFSGSLPMSAKAYPTSRWGTSAHTMLCPPVWRVAWRMPSRRSMRTVSYLFAYSSNLFIVRHLVSAAAMPEQPFRPGGAILRWGCITVNSGPGTIR